MRLIDADHMKRYIDCGHFRQPSEVRFSELDVVRMLDKMPTIEAEPERHGHWIDKGWLINECSLCGRNEHFAQNYCPKCGAKMDEKE